MPAARLLLRPAVDARPPAQTWLRRPPPDPVPPDQPPLGFSEETAPLTAPPTPAASRSVSVDTVPAGLDPARSRELDLQARTWAPWFAQLLVEAIDGRRSLEPLGHWLDDWVLAEVSRRVRLQSRSRARNPTATPQAPGSVLSLRAQFSHPRVLEVAVHLRRGRRSYACAFQLRRIGARWRCTALELRG